MEISNKGYWKKYLLYLQPMFPRKPWERNLHTSVFYSDASSVPS